MFKLDNIIKIMKAMAMNPYAVTVLIIFILGVATVFISKLLQKTKPKAQGERPPMVKEVNQSIDKGKSRSKKEILGTGAYRCMAFRPGNIVDFTTMPEPIGEMYQADTSCPVSGALFVVRETVDGDVVDYDPRDMPFKADETPSFAYMATHPEPFVKPFWTARVPWWQSPAVWFAAALVAVTFITYLGVLGG